jgi:hypothetical protein
VTTDRATIGRGDFPAWTRARSLSPLMVLIPILAVYEIASLYFESIYATRYSYQVPLAVGVAHGWSVRLRLRQMRSLLTAVPENRQLYSLLARPLSRPALYLPLLLAFIYGLRVMVFPLAQSSVPPSPMDFGAQSMPSLQIQLIRAGAILLSGLTHGILAGFILYVGSVITANLHGLRMTITGCLLLLISFLSHHAWALSSAVAGRLSMYVAHPSLIIGMWTGSAEEQGGFSPFAAVSLVAFGIVLLLSLLAIDRICGAVPKWRESAQ